MVTLTVEEILGTRGYHAAETILLDSRETLRHSHEFYELFLMEEGEVLHYSNETQQLLLPGTLCLIRPEDEHSFRKNGKKTAHFVNIAFSKAMFEQGEHLWKTAYNNSLDGIKYQVVLPGVLSQALILKMMYLMNYMTNIGEIPAQQLILAILFDSLICLHNQTYTQEAIPFWLESTCRSMNKSENYLEGIPRFVELSGKSQEHLTRMMHKYYGTTPSAYLNSLRLKHAAALLRTTDDAILEIMLESGFNSVSYFNQRFREVYGVSPSGYRKHNRMIINPF